jgi:ATP-dependent RNA helicase
MSAGAGDATAAAYAAQEGPAFESTVKPVKTFEEMNLRPELLRAMYSYGYNTPSAIQQRLLPPLMRRKDLIAQAASGSGKTSALCIGALQLVEREKSETQVLVLGPTRELVQQIATVCTTLASDLGVTVHASVGGKNVTEDDRRLKAGGVHIVAGTPGRVFDLIRRKALTLTHVRTFILDEADEMLGRGFLHQIHQIYRLLPPTIQTALISATMPKQILDLADKLLTEPERILVPRDEISVESIKQYFIAVEKEEWKYDTICDLYETMQIGQAVIFCNTRKKVEWLANKLVQGNFNVSSMHGDMPQAEREEIMHKFREGKSRILIATDVWARGIDVAQVSMVINYDLPTIREQYLHRIGRAGRFGREGVAVTLVKRDEDQALKDIEAHYGIHITEMPNLTAA